MVALSGTVPPCLTMLCINVLWFLMPVSGRAFEKLYQAAKIAINEVGAVKTEKRKAVLYYLSKHKLKRATVRRMSVLPSIISHSFWVEKKERKEETLH
jgi:hypothetical protein